MLEIAEERLDGGGSVADNLHVCADRQISKLEMGMEDEAAFFKVLSEPTRLRLAVLLSIHGETCVCGLAEALGAPEYNISRHLGIMRSAGLVEARREGTWMYYRLSEARNRLEECLQECFRDCLADHPTVRTDAKRLSGATCKAE